MKQTYIVRWNSTSERGFRSMEAAQQFIDRVCMPVAPKNGYVIMRENNIMEV